MNPQAVLSRFAFFTEADAPLRAQMLAAAKALPVPASTELFSERSRCQRVALIGSGRIRVFKATQEGREITLYSLEAGDTCVLTATCLLADSLYPASAVADTDCELLVFDATTFRRWIDADGGLRRCLFSTLAERMADVITLVEEVSFNRMDDRLARLLCRRLADQPEWRVTHEQLAAELGTVREVISRLLKDFERRGAIDLQRGRIVAADLSCLN